MRDYFAEEIAAPALPAPRPAPKVIDFYAEEIASAQPADKPLIKSAKKMGKAVAAASVAGPWSWTYGARKDPEVLEGGMRAAGEVLPAVPAVIPFNMITNMAVQAQEEGLDPRDLAKSAMKALPFTKTIKTIKEKGPSAVLDQESLTEPLELKPPRRLLLNAIKAVKPDFKEPTSDDPMKQLAIDLGLDFAGGIGPAGLEAAGARGIKALSTASREATALRALKTLKNLPERKARIALKFKQPAEPAANLEPLSPSTTAPEIPSGTLDGIRTAPTEPVKIAGGEGPAFPGVKLPEPDLNAAALTESALKAPGSIDPVKGQVDILKEARKVRRAASAKFPAFSKALSEIHEKIGGEKPIAGVKKVERIASKVLAHQSPEYSVRSLKDHVRGTVFVDDFSSGGKALQAIKEKFPNAVIELKPGDGPFGYRGVHASVPIGKGLNAEIQVHTPASFKVKGPSDRIYKKWREINLNHETATPQRKMAFARDAEKARKLWRDFYDSQPQAAKDFLDGKAGASSTASAEINLAKEIEPSSIQVLSSGSKTSALPPERIGDISTSLPSSNLPSNLSISSTSTPNITAPGGKSKVKLSPKDSLLLAVENAKTRLAATKGEAPKGKLTVKFKTPGGEYTIKNTPEALADFEKRLQKGVKVGGRDAATKGQKVLLNNELGMARIGKSFDGMSEDEIRAEVNRLIGERLERVKPGNKERKFITSVSNRPNTVPEVAANIESQYTVLPNKKTFGDADKFVAENREQAILLAKGKETPTAFSNAVADKLAVTLQEEGSALKAQGNLAGANLKFEEAIDIIENTAGKNTGLGQAIQALSRYSKLTPEGVTRFAQRTLDKAAQEVTKGKPPIAAPDLAKLPEEIQKVIKKTKGYISDDQLKKLPPALQKLVAKNAVPPAAAKQLQKLTLQPALVQQLQGLAQKVQVANTPRQRAVATAQLLKAITAQTPVSIWRKISTAQTLAQLLNFKTAGRNILGNVGFAGLENVSDAAAAAFDKAVSLATGTRSKVLPNLKVQFRGAARGFREGVEDVKLGINTSGNPTQYNLPAPGIFKSKVGQSFEKMLNYELQVPDRMAYTAAYRESLLNQMKSAKAIKPTDEMLEIAHHEGLYRTFQDDNVITKVFVGLKKALNAGGEFGLGDAILKYPKTPANILARGIEYSPAGFMQSMLELGRGALGHGFDQRKFVQSAARAFVGTNLIGTGILMARLGLITGRKKESSGIIDLKKKIGLGDYKINVSGVKRFVLSGFDPDEAKLRKGDVLKTYDWFLPQAIDIAIGANIEEGKGGPGSVVGTLADSIASGSRTLAEQPLVSGLQRAFGYGDVVGGVGETLKGVPASFVPSLLRQIGMLVDDIRRNPDSEDPLEETANLIKMKIPGLSKSVPSKPDPFGDEVHYLRDSKTFLGKAASALLDPANTSRYGEDKDTKAAEELIKFRVNVTKQGKSLQGIELTEQEQAAIDKQTGPMAKTLLRALIRSKEYAAADDLMKEKLLRGAIRASKNEAEKNNAPAIASRYLGKKAAA